MLSFPVLEFEISDDVFEEKPVFCRFALVTHTRDDILEAFECIWLVALVIQLLGYQRCARIVSILRCQKRR